MYVTTILSVGLLLIFVAIRQSEKGCCSDDIHDNDKWLWWFWCQTMQPKFELSRKLLFKSTSKIPILFGFFLFIPYSFADYTQAISKRKKRSILPQFESIAVKNYTSAHKGNNCSISLAQFFFPNFITLFNFYSLLATSLSLSISAHPLVKKERLFP